VGNARALRKIRLSRAIRGASTDGARTIERSSGADVLVKEETAARYFNGVDRLILG
jgi:hypothetical protein